MKKNLFLKFKKENARRGFMLIELLAAIGIIAVLAGVGIPSAIAIKEGLDMKERDNYAKTVFMAAQTTLSQLQASGGLEEFVSYDSNCIPEDAPAPLNQDPEFSW